jgi:hypothetical protein
MLVPYERVRSLHLACSIAVVAVVACTPDIPTDPPFEAETMDFDPTARPPRVPEPSHVLINPGTGRLDFSLAGIPVPADCAMQMVMPQAQCEFYQYLQTLDGYPTVALARAPASSALDPETLTPANVVVIDATAREVVTDRVVVNDRVGRALTILPGGGWKVGRLYIIGVRGYERGVKAANGRQVVAPVPYVLLKQTTSLTCGATTPDAIPATCGAYGLLASQMDPAAARATVFQLEALRASFQMLQATELLDQVGGIPRNELAMFWAFPTHSAPVAELDPSAGVTPQVTPPSTIKVALKGMIDPAKIVVTTAGKPGTVTLMDLTSTAAADLLGGLPPVDVAYEAGAIVLRTRQPLAAGHQYGLFFTNGVTSPEGKGLVPSPVSFLLKARGPLADAAGKSQVSNVPDPLAPLLEDGRSALAELLENPLVQAVVGLDRAKLSYVYAFSYGGP